MLRRSATLALMIVGLTIAACSPDEGRADTLSPRDAGYPSTDSGTPTAEDSRTSHGDESGYPGGYPGSADGAIVLGPPVPPTGGDASTAGDGPKPSRTPNPGSSVWPGTAPGVTNPGRRWPSGSWATSTPPMATATVSWVTTPLESATPWLTPTDPATPTPDPFLAAGAPTRLQVPAIGVDALVEQVGLTSDRSMAAPKGWMNVGWFLHGFRPGEIGNSVIAGHLDTNTGGPAVFWDLNQLRPGDEATVTYENGDRYTFVVGGSELYDADAQGPTIEKIFGSSQTADLNLVTCDGAWDHGRATYAKRLVVFSELMPEKTVLVGDSGAFH